MCLFSAERLRYENGSSHRSFLGTVSLCPAKIVDLSLIGRAERYSSLMQSLTCLKEKLQEVSALDEEQWARLNSVTDKSCEAYRQALESFIQCSSLLKEKSEGCHLLSKSVSFMLLILTHVLKGCEMQDAASLWESNRACHVQLPLTDADLVRVTLAIEGHLMFCKQQQVLVLGNALRADVAALDAYNVSYRKFNCMLSLGSRIEQLLQKEAPPVGQKVLEEERIKSLLDVLRQNHDELMARVASH